MITSELGISMLLPFSSMRISTGFKISLTKFLLSLFVVAAVPGLSRTMRIFSKTMKKCDHFCSLPKNCS